MHVKQINNLFSLMELFVREKRPLSVREIVDEFQWPRSSVFNIVTTLVDGGYLYQPIPRGGYYPSTKWMDLAQEVCDSQPLPKSVHELLVELAKETGETVLLAAPEGAEVVFLDVVESQQVIRFTASIGQRIPIHVTSAGQALLSLYNPSERAALLKRINYRRYETDAFMTPEAVEAELKSSQNRGWFINLAKFAPDLAGISVPFAFRNRRNAIVLGAPISRVQERVDTLGRLLADRVSRFISANEY